MLTDLVQIRQLTEMHRADTLPFQRHLAAHHYPDGRFRIFARTVAQQIDLIIRNIGIDKTECDGF